MWKSGSLFVIGTPIGNLSDLTQRAAKILADVGLVAAEDTRRARKLLSHLQISKPLVRCDEMAEERAAMQVLDKLRAGFDVAFVSDAGTPTVSDPGVRLTQRVVDSGFRVVPLPGASAVMTALSASGFLTTPFRFHGFLSKKGDERLDALKSIAQGPDTSVFFESPVRIGKTLAQLAHLNPERRACIARELTKVHEELMRGTLRQLTEILQNRKTKGECTVVVEGMSKKEAKRFKRKSRNQEEE